MSTNTAPVQNVLNYRKRTRAATSVDIEKISRDMERMEKRLAKLEKNSKSEKGLKK